MDLSSLKACSFKNRKNYFWAKNGFLVNKLHNGYWLTSYNYSGQFNTMQEVKNEIKTILK